MKVIKEDGVRLYIDNNKKYHPCEWVMCCPVLNGMDVHCDDCPAFCINPKITYAEALKWWEKAEIKK